MPHLAIRGGTPIRSRPFPYYNTIGGEEKALVNEVLESGILSGFVGSPGEGFLGGPKVRQLEREWCARFGVKHAVAMNSATSALCMGLKALSMGPGDEVIVSASSMSATVTSILYSGARPVFCDMEPETFNMDPDLVEGLISPRTRAILVAHLFGHPAAMPRIMEIAGARGIKVMEDNAQSAGAAVDGRLAGTFGDVNIFSLNRHKIIQSGEGGIAVTDDDELALRLRLLRNHGENSTAALGRSDLAGLFGLNYRMTELEAAVSIAQLRKLDGILEIIAAYASYLTDRISPLPGYSVCGVRPGCRHVWLHHTILYDEDWFGVPLETFMKALHAEGFGEIWSGYHAPLYLLPLFADRPECRPGLCPVTERMQSRMIAHDLHRPPCTLADMKNIADVFEKLSACRDELKGL